MTHMTDATNGASLEDSHTNFFALADLSQSNGMNQSNGINWRKLCANSVLCLDPLEDPVLSSYSKCLSAGILCVWRRVVSQKTNYNSQAAHNDGNVNYTKELWIFWYGEEPDLNGLVGPNLREAEQGSWESGLSYECRILLFKALHNLIEKYLLSKGFTRLGRFFTEPRSLPHVGASRSQIAFAFSFFVHGESTVCTSVDIRVSPSVYQLRKCHLQAASTGAHSVKVILSPYGMQGTLTGQAYRQNDPAALKMLAEWYSFYPRPCRRDRNDMPAVVEVLVGGVRMKYPTSYVFVVEPGRTTTLNVKSTSKNNRGVSCGMAVTNRKPCPSLSILTPPTSPERSSENLRRSQIFMPKHTIAGNHALDHSNNKNTVLPSIVKFSVCEEVMISQQNEGGDEAGVMWEFQDPSTLAKCSCGRKTPCSKEGTAHSSIHDHQSTSRIGKQDKNQPLAHFAPFHKRVHNLEVFEDIVPAPKTDFCNSETGLSTTSHLYSNSNSHPIKGYGANQNISNGGLVTLPQLHTPLTQPSSVDSHSNIPSVEACSQICSSDPIMPTLSPHPKAENHVTFTHSPNTDIGPTINIKDEQMSDEMFSTSLLAYFEDTKKPGVESKIKNNDCDFSEPPRDGNETDKAPCLKRPVLPNGGCDNFYDEELVMRGSLYDYSNINFREPPLRRRRVESGDDICEIVLDGNNSSPYDGLSYTPKDPYEFIDIDEGTPSENLRLHIDTKIKEEDQMLMPISGTGPDELTAAQLHAMGKISVSEIKGLINQSLRLSQPKFIREEDLTVSVHDLDNIFDTSSSDNDDLFASHTVNAKTAVTTEDCNVKMSASNANTGLLELSRMYPTPPSLEQNAVQSPLGTNGINEKLMYDESERERDLTDILFCLSSDTGKNMSVWKTDEMQLSLESDKYSPLNGLLSLGSLPSALRYKSSWDAQTVAPNGEAMYCNGQLAEGSVDINQQVRYVLDDDEHIYNPSYVVDNNIDQRFGTMASDLQSPPSNASSYLNRNMNSVDDSSMSPPIAEAHGLFVNLLLSDSMLNIFKDHNFDSCALCVCNMNIKGGDVGINLPCSLVPYESDETQYKCTCGFSAVVYRHHSYSAGLFCEDEFDIAGFQMNDAGLSRYLDLPPNASDSKGSNAGFVPPSIIDLIKIQCKSLCSSFSVFQKQDMLLHATVPPKVNALEIRDGCEVCFSALEVGKNITDNVVNSQMDENLKPSCLHKWPYSNNPLPCTSQEMMLHMDLLKPMLQEAVHKRNTQRMWEVTYVVEGPLTWREFHRLAARGTEDQCEPQPIPSVTVGYENDYLSLSPFALKFWDKLLLEPYSLPRDVAYIVVAPENDYILNNVKSFFRELSSMYELLKMGRHSPITKVLRDGIMRVGRNAAMKLADEPVDEWFNHIGDSPIANKLRLYARVCCHRLAPHLSDLNLDKSLLESPASKTEKIFNSMNSAVPSTQECFDPSAKHLESENDSSHGPSANGLPFSLESVDDEDQQSPAIVIYIVEPFTFASVEPNLYRTVTLGLLRCYAQMLDYLPESKKESISLQLISLDSLMCMDKSNNDTRRKNELKSLAFSVFSQCHRLLPRQLAVKSLTGFGPAAAQDTFLLSNEKFYNPLKIFGQPLVLAPLKDKQAELGEMFGDGQEKSGILYCSYCLTEDKRWLLACCTNSNGEVMETTVINVATPTRSRRKCAAVRRRGLMKLLDFILEVLSNSVHPWRIIIGRLGHLGHGELKDWAALLSRKSLLSYSRHLREICKQCSGLGPGDMPSILSACLVSLEPDTVLRLMPDQYTPDMHDSSTACHLSTPEDASCTHILVFPTSATMQSSQATSHQEHIDSLHGGLGDDIFEALNDDDINVGQDINDIFRWSESPAAISSNSPHLDVTSHTNSPNVGGLSSPFHAGGPNRSFFATADCLDEPLQLLQQPLALGYYVSTAKTGHLPNWFWASCPHLANRMPVFLKFALLIHLPSIQQNSDDILHANAPQQNCHPLDSNFTTDVLRYVLEGYNALSWLSLDPTSHDRRSCLPVHIQIMMQLYRIVENLL